MSRKGLVLCLHLASVSAVRFTEVTMHWFGLYRNDELVLVEQFDHHPTLCDFGVGYIGSDEYTIRPVRIIEE